MLDRDETQKANFDTKRRKLQMDLKKKKWNEDERTKLIELIEERECLQTLWCRKYSKILEKPVEAVKVKINGLHVKVGWEINKENKNKKQG